MRISDWSSDVCSSDLRRPARPARSWGYRSPVVEPRLSGTAPAPPCQRQVRSGLSGVPAHPPADAARRGVGQGNHPMNWLALIIYGGGAIAILALIHTIRNAP